jgi:hypothetical protein
VLSTMPYEVYKEDKRETRATTRNLLLKAPTTPVPGGIGSGGVWGVSTLASL